MFTINVSIRYASRRTGLRRIVNQPLDYAIVFLFKNLVYASLCSSSFFLLIIGPVILLYTELKTLA